MRTKRFFQLTRVFFISFLVAFVFFNSGLIGARVDLMLSRLFGSSDNSASATYVEYPIKVTLLPITTEQDKNTSPQLPVLSGSAVLVIEKLGVTTPLIFDAPNEVSEIFNLLKKGVVNHPITPKPGAGGTSIILGHSSGIKTNNPYLSIFSTIKKLNPGDTFYIQYDNGTRFDYIMEESFVFNPFNPNDSKVKEFDSKPLDNGIVLVTCWPPGTDVNRLAVHAVQIN